MFLYMTIFSKIIIEEYGELILRVDLHYLERLVRTVLYMQRSIRRV